jgi:hypothetical protein
VLGAAVATALGLTLRVHLPPLLPLELRTLVVAVAVVALPLRVDLALLLSAIPQILLRQLPLQAPRRSPLLASEACRSMGSLKDSSTPTMRLSSSVLAASALMLGSIQQRCPGIEFLQNALVTAHGLMVGLLLQTVLVLIFGLMGRK